MDIYYFWIILLDIGLHQQEFELFYFIISQ